MIRLSQAHSLVLGQVFRLLVPAVITCAALVLTSRQTNASLSTWLITFLAIFAVPSYHIGYAKLRYWHNARKAARLGAVLPPRWQGNLPGSWDLMQLVDQAYYRGFLSKSDSLHRGMRLADTLS